MCVGSVEWIEKGIDVIMAHWHALCHQNPILWGFFSTPTHITQVLSLHWTKTIEYSVLSRMISFPASRRNREPERTHGLLLIRKGFILIYCIGQAYFNVLFVCQKLTLELCSKLSKFQLRCFLINMKMRFWL